MSGIKYSVLLTATAIVSLVCQHAKAETLPDALGELIQNHPQIRAAHNTAYGSEESVNKVWGTYLPSVDAKADTGMERINSPARRSSGLDPFYRDRNTYTFSLTQKLWDGGAREGLYAATKYQRDAAVFTANTTTQNVLFEGISVYLDVLKQTRLAELAAQNENTIRQQLHLEDERVRRGSGIAVDVLQAKTRLQLAKERRVAFEGALDAALSRYLQVYGHPAELAEMVTPTLPEALIPDDLDTAIERAKGGNPTIAVSRAQSSALEESRSVAEAGYLPTINLVMEHGYENGRDAVIGTRRDYSVLVQASWNLFNGLQTRAEVSKAAFDHAASMDNLTHANRKVIEQTRLAWQALDTARKRVDLLNNAVNIAGEVFAARTKLRDAGKETALNVLDAENEVYNARINHTTATFDMKIAMFQLLLAMGELDSPRVASN
ncbi:MAG: TolC family outer membrane protein [Rhodospirillaceae bacterium]|nr:TolC family outer membrane protein [Rhodospirillaceae bacterium]